MHEQDQTTTLSIKACGACGVGIVEPSNYCRLCGAPQELATASATLSSTELISKPADQFTTTRLSKGSRYHPVSGPLVGAVVAGVPANLGQSTSTAVSRRILLTLMAIPIWVMIILLSPLDAYASAKIIGNRI
jgi:hypothetical protein